MEVVQSNDYIRRLQLAEGTDERELNLVEDIEELKAQLAEGNKQARVNNVKRNLIVGATLTAVAGLALAKVSIPKFLTIAGTIITIGSVASASVKNNYVKVIPSEKDFSDMGKAPNDEKSYTKWLKKLTGRVAVGLMYKMKLINAQRYDNLIKKVG